MSAAARRRTTEAAGAAAARRHRPRVLLLEDEPFIATDLSLTLQSMGYEVAGPCRTVAEAQEVVERLRPDAAVLDISLGGRDTSFAILAMLIAADVPFLFVSSFPASVLPPPPGTPDHVRLSKPVDLPELEREVRRLVEV